MFNVGSEDTDTFATCCGEGGTGVVAQTLLSPEPDLLLLVMAFGRGRCCKPMLVGVERARVN